ncbi:MAG: hypothetical protein IJW40_09345 [Clostridia bacterium]|nr:hypothetical protein [Clostridia bacterium]
MKTIIKNPWVQVDPGESMLIGSAELVYRPDGDMAGQRAFFQIWVSVPPTSA